MSTSAASRGSGAPGPPAEPHAPEPPAGAGAPADASAVDDPGRFRLGYRRELDGLRGIAVLLVFVYHAGQLLWPECTGWLVRGGFLGVDLFFVLSGFLITVLLLGEADRRGRVALGAFAVRRVRRLVPALVAVLAAAAALASAGELYEPGVVRRSALTVLTFTHNWAMVEGWQVGLGYLWSVAVEAQFYVLWAVVVALAARTRRPHVVLAAVAGAGIVAVATWRWVQFGAGEPAFALYVATPARLDAPLVGSLAGVVAAAGWLRAFRGRTAAVAGALALAAFVGVALRADVSDVPLYRGAFTAIAAAGAVCVLAAVRAAPGRWRTLLSTRVLVSAGLVSYSLYVWHLVVFEVLREHAATWSPPLRLAAGVAASLAAAVVSYRFVERPFLRRAAGRRVRAPVVEVPALDVPAIGLPAFRVPPDGAPKLRVPEAQAPANPKQRSASEPNAYTS